MVDIIFDSAKIIINWIFEQKKQKKEINEEISVFLLDISKLLDDTRLKLLMGEYPHDNCHQMEVLKNNLLTALDGKMNLQDITKLREYLDLSTKLESLYSQRQDKKVIKKLNECTGFFRAMSQIVKIK